MANEFVKPLFDNSLTLPQWIQYNGLHSPNHPLFTYSNPNIQAEPLNITWSQASQAINNAAHLLHGIFEPGFENNARPPVVAVLANLDVITYNTLIWGIITAGGTAFLVSTRNSSVAVSHLLKKTGTNILIVTSDEATSRLARSALADPEIRDIAVHPAPTFQDLYSQRNVKKYAEPITDYYKQDIFERPAVILHSSGTTAFPKPITFSHRRILQYTRISSVGGANASKHRLSTHGLPAFHGMGFFGPCWATRTGIVIAVFPPQDPPVLPSLQNVLEAAVACRCTCMLSVPHFIELWSRDPETVEHLKNMDGIIYGGGPLNKAIGDDLHRAGVCLVGFYGLTEAGPVGEVVFGIPESLNPVVPLSPIISLSDPEDTDWDWLNMGLHVDARFVPLDDKSDECELVFVECTAHTLAHINSEVDGKPALCTNDIVVKHPTNPLKFKVLGRKDDQIMLSTGEKTNPGPIEVILCRDPLIERAVMFGRGRSQNGVLIQPSKGNEFDPSDQILLAKFRNDIWPCIERANAFAPSHSRLFKEMILVTHPSRPMELTAKLAPRRSVVIETYKQEINAAYAAVDDSTQNGTSSFEWTALGVLEFVRSVVHDVMNKDVPIKDHDDIFLHGGDSLQATYIRNSILRAVRANSQHSAHQISQSFVYEHPTISQLSNQILTIVHITPEEHHDLVALKVKRMMQLISDFTLDFPTHEPSTTLPVLSGEVVLITGTTGGLGTQLLAQISSSPDVARVYALNRADKTSTTLYERQADALTRRGLPASILDTHNITLVECDTSLNDLGIDPTLYNEIRHNVTLIIHNAWRVNFNLGLDSFEPNIRGVRNLIDLALRSPRPTPPRYIFASSIGIFRNWKTLNRPLEIAHEDPTTAVGSGYSESKWIGEQILEKASKCTPLRPVSVRIGQLTSNSSGAWNVGDWLPAIVRSGQVLGALPSRDDSITWILLNTAASAIFEFRSSKSPYLHLAHPNPVSWTKVFNVFSSMLNVPLIPWEEWLRKLENHTENAVGNPAVHLLDFFRGCSAVCIENREALGFPMLDLTEALKVSPSLADPSLPQVSTDDAEAWVKYWRKVGLLDG